MKLKVVLKRLVVLAALATVIGVGHALVMENEDAVGLYVASQHVPFAPISDEEAFVSGASLHQDRISLMAENTKEFKECEAEQQTRIFRMRCDLIFARRQPVFHFGEIKTNADLVAVGHGYHRQQWEEKEAGPVAAAWPVRFYFAFGLAYFVMALFAAFWVFKWMWFEGWPTVKAGAAKVRLATPLPADLKTMGANRKLRQAENDFQTLKSLRDNGLITEDMFQTRKAVLREGLGNNEVFVKDNR